MSRIFQDEDFTLWEAFASTGPFGYPDHASIVFHSLTDPASRPRRLRYDGDRAAAERALRHLSDAELRALLRRAEPLP